MENDLNARSAVIHRWGDFAGIRLKGGSIAPKASDKNVKAVVLSIDIPGGAPVEADEFTIVRLSERSIPNRLLR
jgi:ClpP class serine protease